MRVLVAELERVYAEIVRTAGETITLDSGSDIEWVDNTGDRVGTLGFGAVTGLGAEVGHIVAKSFASQQTTSGTYVDKTGATIAHASFDDNEDYLCYVRATHTNLTSQATAVNAIQVTYNDTVVSGGEKLWEGAIGITNVQGQEFSWCGIVSTGATGDLQVEFKSGNGSDTIDVGYCTLLAIKVSDLTLNTNIFHDTDTATFELDDGNFPPTNYVTLGSSITIGDGTSDYLVFACIQIGDFVSGGNTPDWRIRESAGNTVKVMGKYGMNDLSDEVVRSWVGLYKAQAATTLTIEATCTGFPADAKRSFLCAIRLNAFAQHFTGYVADADESGWSFPEEQEVSISATATQTSSNWGFIGAVTDNYGGSGLGQPTILRLDIAGAGDNTIGGDATWKFLAGGTNHGQTRFAVSVDQTINSGQTIDADMVYNTPTSSTSAGVTEQLIIAFTWELSGTADVLDVGNPNFVTNYLGKQHRFFGADGVDYFEFDIDGTDLNMTGFQIADINLTGITAINAGTVDVDFDAITATTYGGITEANLVDKNAAETIAAEWDFTTNPKIDAAGIDTGTFADGRIAESNVTQHEAALSIASSQLTGLQLTDNSDVTTAAVTDKFALMADGSAYVGRAILEADISDLQAYLTSFTEVNNLTAAVTWANVPDANITVGSVTQHEAALTILESQITDGSILARVAGTEIISGAWTHSGRLVTDDSTTSRAGFNIPTGVDPTSPVQGDIWVTATDIFARINGVSESLKGGGGGGDKVYRIGHTYGIISKVKVPSGQKDFIIPFFVSFASGQTVKLVKARHIINDGTSVTCKLQKNGVDITGFTGISVTTTAADTDPADVTLADNDKLALLVTATAGTPQNMSFTIFLEYTT